jgi:amino acid adenylation domain-containing protein
MIRMSSYWVKPVRTGGPIDNLHDFLLAPAAIQPDAPAVIEVGPDGDLVTVTFGELEHRVAAWSAALTELGLDVGDRVIVESQVTADAIAMLAACSGIGLTFITVSPSAPGQRLASIIEAAEPALYAQAAVGTREGIPASVGTLRFGPDGLVTERAPRPSRNPYRREVVGTDPAYIIFTSGTTGRPKGVVMSHRAVIAFLRGALIEGVATAGDRIATTSPLQFDFALGDIGLALGSGAAIVPVPRERLNWPRRFVGFLREAGVTQVHGVPSIWRSVLRHEPELLDGLPLRRIMFSGEDFPLPELRQLQALLPDTRLINCYGATESMACSFTDVPASLPEDAERLSIGRAHLGAEMMIVDEQGRPIEQNGRTGEIYLRSPALFSGYWDDPAATRAALIPDPLNPRSGQIVFRTGDLAFRGEAGELYFCGRRDSQVQIRGNRVELGEVERRLLEFPAVAAATALVLPGEGGSESELHAFVVAKPGETGLGQSELRAFCLQTLPDYMAPRGIHLLDELPLTENGKVDRRRLASLVSTGS